MTRALIAIAFAASSFAALTGIVVAPSREGCATAGQRQPR
jgi:hypothetical protein